MNTSEDRLRDTIQQQLAKEEGRDRLDLEIHYVEEYLRLLIEERLVQQQIAGLERHLGFLLAQRDQLANRMGKAGFDLPGTSVQQRLKRLGLDSDYPRWSISRQAGG